MVVDEAGVFITQRDEPRLALIRATPIATGLRLSAPGLDNIDATAGGAPIGVQVWKDHFAAATCATEVDQWLSAAIGKPCRLVHLDDPARRKVAERYRLADETVTFADAFPVLLTSLDSLLDLNTRLASPIPISRFRGNIVVAGGQAWAEDSWRIIRIGTATFRMPKPCDRCIVTTIDQDTATRPDKAEPLRTLATFRRDQRGVMFGQNLIPLTQGQITVGDQLDVLEQGPPNVTPL
jgi:uncharacterized protein YcbX